MKVGILALQGDVAEHAQVLAELGAQPVEVRGPHELAGVDALVLPGGESTAMSLLLESSGLGDAVADALADGVPALGTCAGMILLGGEVLGGAQLGPGGSSQRCFGAIDIAVRRNAFGRQVQSFECDLDVAGVPGGPVRAVFIRAPVVERVGPGVEVLAEVGGRPVVCRQGPVIVAAFHPEISGDGRLHQLFLSTAQQIRGW